MSTYKSFFNIGVSVVVSFIASTSYAQTFTDYDIGPQGGQLRFTIDPEQAQIEGNPNYNTNWTSGEVYYNNNLTVKVDKLNYNINVQELLYNENGVTYVVPKKENIKGFKIGNKKFIVLGSVSKQDFSFYEVLEDGGRLQLLKGYTCTIKRGQPSKGYIQGTKDQYVKREDIIIALDKHPIGDIKPRRGKKILKYLKKDEEKIEEYIRTEKLKMNTMEDLIKVVQYYNTL